MRKKTPNAPAKSVGVAAKEKAIRGLPVIEERAGGIDVGARHMQVCIPLGEQVEVRTYATTTEAVRECAVWLQTNGIRSVALESTGVYWIPVVELLEAVGLEVLLVDTRPLSRVPGRKSDVLDAKWIQTLHSHGLLQGCFRPAGAIQELRQLSRAKATLVAQQADWIRRIQKSLDQMNVRVHHAVSDVKGVTGMKIIRAIVAGERDPARLAELRETGCQKSTAEIRACLTGHWRADHLFNLQQALELYDAHQAAIAQYDREIERRLQEMTPVERKQRVAPALPNRERMKAIKRRGQGDRRQALFQMAGCDLTTIDGIGVETAEVILSEYGLDLQRFARESEFVSHLQLAPWRPVSGGKVLKGKRKTRGTRAGEALRTAAVTLGRSATALGAYYRQIAARKGAGVAVFATARKLAQHVYRLLRWGQPYLDIGQQQYQQRYQERKLKALQATASLLGFSLVQKEAASV